MSKNTKPRAGSLQFWPRKRSRKKLHSVNWDAINSDSSLLGVIGYKVGMASCFVKDNTSDSMTEGKKIVLPSTIVELPPLKILSVRFYKDGETITEVLADNIDKELKKKLKLPKQNKSANKEIEKVEDWDKIRVIVYSQPKETSLKKKPDLIELGVGKGKGEILEWIKEKLNKPIKASEILETNQLVDARGLTKGKGTQGPVKRFGIKLKAHNSEKGRRNVGSMGPWHPARVTFRTPMAGQTGLNTRVKYNNQVVKVGSVEEENINPEGGWKNYGNIKSEYAIIKGSLPGPAKRQLLLTMPLRPGKKTKKQEYDFEKLE